MTSKGDNMHGQTHLLKRGSRYYFRIRIPDDLRAFYKDQWELKESLRTSDKREAAQLCRLRAAAVAEEFERHRYQRDTARGKISRRRVSKIDQAFLNLFKNRWMWEVLANDDVRRRAGLDAEEFSELRNQANETQELLQQALARGDVAVVGPALNNMLYLLGVELDVPEDDYRRLGYSFLQAATEANDFIRKRNAGEVIETERIVTQDRAFPLNPKASKKTGLLDLYDYWRTATQRPSKTEATYKATVTLFLDIIGDKPVNELRKADFVVFKDALVERKLHFKTVSNKLVHLKAILNYAVENDRLESNPASLVKVAKPKVKPVSRLPFNLEDLKLIFDCPLYSAGQRPKGGAGEASVWLPLLSLLSGARENELGQLLVGDVLKDPIAGYYIQVIDEGDDAIDEEGDESQEKTVKTEASRRQVPVHPALIKAGFIKYRDAIAATGSEQLFPDLVPDCHGHITGNWSKWFGRYLRKTIGITNPKKVYHSLRHCFKDACRNSGLGEEIHDALTGHTNSSVSRNYGSGHSLKSLAQAMAKINYPDLVIPDIAPPTAKSKTRRSTRTPKLS